MSFLDLQTFLDESAVKLQTMFDTVCGFRNVQQVLLHHMGDMIEEVTRLQFAAGKMCEISEHTDSTAGTTIIIKWYMLLSLSAYASRVIAVVCLSECLSVCPLGLSLTLAGRVCNYHSTTLLAIWHINVTTGGALYKRLTSFSCLAESPKVCCHYV